MRSRVLLFVLLCAVPAMHAQDPVDGSVAGPLPASKSVQAKMTNESVIRMAKAGLGDDLIVQTITTQPGQAVKRNTTSALTRK